MNILSADIGGTNSRFAYFKFDSQKNLTMIDAIDFKTTDVKSFPELLEHLKQSRFQLKFEECDTAVFGVAGPVKNNVYCNPPNIPWDIDVSNSFSELGLRQCILINDFVAQAYACRTSAVASAISIQKGNADPAGTIAVIGAGTGLGCCALFPIQETRFIAIPSEGGHASFSFMGKEEKQYEQFVIDKTKQQYCETGTIVSGIGLAMLHEFLTGECLTPDQVALTFHPESKTLKWFSRFYGRVCRNYALTAYASGGLYITGGIAAKNQVLITDSNFLSEFHLSYTFGGFLASIPVFLNHNESSGLYGAAFYGVI